MKKAANAGNAISNEDPKEKEFKEILNSLDYPDPENFMHCVDPMSWKNVSPSMIYAF